MWVYFLKTKYRFRVIIHAVLFMACFPECRQVSPVSDAEWLRTLAILPGNLNETSGLAPAGDGTVFVHNDSGNPPELYQVNPGDGQIKRTIRISGRRNNDWEELAGDSSFLYIGDFGNNAGRRKDLTILKISRTELALRDTVSAGLIQFYYPEQRSFAAGNAHNYDCEAMIAIGDSLYLFTKNRGNLGTDIYRLPKDPGSYPAAHLGHFNTRGLVTAADFLPGARNTLVLLGYETGHIQNKTFLWIASGIEGTHFLGGSWQRRDLATNLQAEAILFNSDTTLLMTNEEEGGKGGKIYELRPTAMGDSLK